MDSLAEHRIINARGPFTPLGVSRSPEPVAAAVARPLQSFADISNLQERASTALSAHAGSEAGTVVHCAAAGITLAVAATMTGSDPDSVAALPATTGLRNRVVLPAGHAVNYGHPLEQAIRLAGATPVFAGETSSCPTAAITREIAHPDTACLLLVVSRLTEGEPVDLAAAIEAAHGANVPVVIDGAAQIFRARELIASGADLLIVSGRKYLGSPTAGLVFGGADLVAAVRAQDKGIGRGMKASKEALAGVLAVLEHWSGRDAQRWAEQQTDKVHHLIDRLDKLDGVTATSEPDPTGVPFPRARLIIDPLQSRRSAAQMAADFKSGSPPIWTMDHRIHNKELWLELVPLRSDELDVLTERLREILS